MCFRMTHHCNWKQLCFSPQLPLFLKILPLVLDGRSDFTMKDPKNTPCLVSPVPCRYERLSAARFAARSVMQNTWRGNGGKPDSIPEGLVGEKQAAIPPEDMKVGYTQATFDIVQFYVATQFINTPQSSASSVTLYSTSQPELCLVSTFSS